MMFHIPSPLTSMANESIKGPLPPSMLPCGCCEELRIICEKHTKEMCGDHSCEEECNHCGELKQNCQCGASIQKQIMNETPMGWTLKGIAAEASKQYSKGYCSWYIVIGGERVQIVPKLLAYISELKAEDEVLREQNTEGIAEVTRLETERQRIVNILRAHTKLTAEERCRRALSILTF